MDRVLTTTDLYYSRSGVRQGSNQGPLEFFIMINDLPKVVEEENFVLVIVFTFR